MGVPFVNTIEFGGEDQAVPNILSNNALIIHTLAMIFSNIPYLITSRTIVLASIYCLVIFY